MAVGPLDTAKVLFAELEKEIPAYMPLYIRKGMLLNHPVEAAESGKKYLEWYAKLDLPLTAKQRDVHQRLIEMEARKFMPKDPAQMGAFQNGQEVGPKLRSRKH